MTHLLYWHNPPYGAGAAVGAIEPEHAPINAHAILPYSVLGSNPAP
eukprot:CAMPEP_0201889022 /NCGR_PEP_ID=MMETSP0902-20130614/28924_1 /ASSEMBLY_ACC=CAM_ASM_000551 /TAXON_ID=420261 /ORGANISM="Thalassiosira antarctica, Strain CCMP982" /LENGTH=45 /DNA_ID= /DNA_START= /DNA_END= /DNA_ORIENTATION=